MPPRPSRYMQLLGLATLGLAAAAQGAESNASLEIPEITPQGTSQPVDSDFPGFAFEIASWPRYAEDDSKQPNEFSLNLIKAIMDRTGGKPIIRLGGTTADYAKYIPSQQEPALPVAEVYKPRDVGGTTIGPSLWDLCKNIPGAQYIIQVPLATTNISETVEWASTAVQRVGKANIQAIEIGNEPNYYGNKAKLGPPKYQGHLTNKTYVGNFTKYASAISQKVTLPNTPIFQAFDTSSHQGSAEGYIFDVETIFNLGINKGNNIKTVAHHYYQTSPSNSNSLSNGLMKHAQIAAHLDFFKPFISYLKQSQSGIPFILSEVGNSISGKQNPSYQNTLGSALWQVDFQLYGMSIGVARVNLQQIMTAGYDMWLPVDSGNTSAQVFSNFYAQPFVADFIGKSGGNTRVKKIPITDGKADVIAYVAYVDDSPRRLAIVNLNFWNGSESTQRPNISIDLHVPQNISRVVVDKLASLQGAVASADNITYAGSQWTHASNGKEVRGIRNDTEELRTTNGKVSITINDSEAALVHFET